MIQKLTFSDSALRKITPPEKGRSFYTDTRQLGLRLSITPNGTMSFQCRAWSHEHRKPITKTIGHYPTLPIALARKLVAETLAAIQGGQDIEQQRRDKATEQELDDIFDRYLLEHAKPHKRSWKDDLSRYQLYIKKPFGKRKITEITHHQIANWHRGLISKVKPATANRAFALLSTIYNICLPEHQNPCKNVKKFKEQSRDRFLQPSELSRFFEAVKNEPNDIVRDYIMLSLFTGARRGNVLAMRWSDINFDLNVWNIPADQSKNAEAITIPLIEEVLEILSKRRKNASSIFVFPGRGKTGHFKEPRKGWQRVCVVAGLASVRLHDLRRTMGSYQTMTGATSTIVGKTLGHKSLAATAIYSRLNTDPVRASMKKAVKAMQIAAEQSEEKITKIGGR
jgi:integrase